jgi:hypothetical protein
LSPQQILFCERLIAEGVRLEIAMIFCQYPLAGMVKVLKEDAVQLKALGVTDEEIQASSVILALASVEEATRAVGQLLE